MQQRHKDSNSSLSFEVVHTSVGLERIKQMCEQDTMCQGSHMQHKTFVGNG